MSLPGLAPSRLCLRIASQSTVRHGCAPRLIRTFSATPFAQRAPRPARPRIPQKPETPQKPSPAGQPKKPSLLRRIKFVKALEDQNVVLTMYQQLSPTYRDKEGLPFSKNDLTEEEVREVFGDKLRATSGNALLRIMHGRRVAGTLSDPAFVANTSRYSPEEIQTALEYLRANVPVDETMNAGLRAEDELEELERQLRAEKDKAEGIEQAEDAYKPDPVYGYSHMEAMAVRNAAKAKAEEKRIQEEREKAGESVPGTLDSYTGTTAVSPRMEKWIEKGRVSDLEEPPDLSTWDRLAPSFTFTLLFLAASVGVAMMYETPEAEDRFFPDISPSTATIAVLIAMNALIYGMWKIPPMWRFLNTFFVSVVGMPRAPAMLGAVFSHQKFNHLFTNMLLLNFIGTRLHDDVGRANFLTIYLGSGMLGYCVGLSSHSLVTSSIGASGGVLGVLAAYFYLHRWDTFKILGFPKPPSEGIHGVVFLSMAFLWSALELFAPAKAAMVAAPDIASHLGGYFAGLGLLVFLETVAKTITGFEDGTGKRKSGDSETMAEAAASRKADEKGATTKPALGTVGSGGKS